MFAGGLRPPQRFCVELTFVALGLLSGCAFDYDVGTFVISCILVFTGLFALAEGVILHNTGGLPAVIIRFLVLLAVFSVGRCAFPGRQMRERRYR